MEASMWNEISVYNTLVQPLPLQRQKVLEIHNTPRRQWGVLEGVFYDLIGSGMLQYTLIVSFRQIQSKPGVFHCKVYNVIVTQHFIAFFETGATAHQFHGQLVTLPAFTLVLRLLFFQRHETPFLHPWWRHAWRHVWRSPRNLPVWWRNVMAK